MPVRPPSPKGAAVRQAIQTAGTVKGRGSSQHAKSDWMEMEKQRGISITTSQCSFPYHDCLVNLLDTPGHEDFSGRYLPYPDGGGLLPDGD